MYPGRADMLCGRYVPKADIALCHSITSSGRNRSEVGIVGLIYERLRWGCARGDLVLRFGREIAGVMSFVQLFFKRPGGAVDHPPALDGRALADFFRPARQVFISVVLLPDPDLRRRVFRCVSHVEAHVCRSIGWPNG